MDLKLEGRTVLVTGGTRGIGRVIVDGFVAEGANVGFCARTVSEVEASEQTISNDGSRNWLPRGRWSAGWWLGSTGACIRA